MIESLELNNFTVFHNLKIDFSPKLNVIIGENGTGKTHLLKAAYGLCCGGYIKKIGEKNIEEALTNKFVRLFMPIDEKLGKMRRYGAEEQARLEARYVHERKIAGTFNSNSKLMRIDAINEYEPAVFIPTKEVLSLVKGMTDPSHDQKTVELIFDAGYIDLAEALMRPGCDDPEAKISLDPRFGTIIPKLVNLIGGRYQLESGGFCFQSGKYIEKPDPSHSNSRTAQIYQDSTITSFESTKEPVFSSGMTAEGFRKIGILHRLLVNGTLNPGASGPLFWDEPESNMNPKLMKMLVEILLELSRNGLQVILATHDYVLLKWIDLLMKKDKGDHVVFHSLYRHTETGEIKVNSMDNYSIVSKSAISDTFAELYDEDVNRALG